MSILGAVGIGLAAGAAASGYIFNYTKNEYEQKINELQLSVDALQVHLNDMKALRDRVSQFWDDDNGRAVYAELERTIIETEREMETVKEFIRTFQVAVSELDGSQGIISGVIEDLKGLVGSGIKG